MKEQDPGRRHYSDKGGHQERSTFHKDVGALAKLIARELKVHPRFHAFQLAPVVPIDQARQIRRQMRRITDDGR